MRSNIWSRDIVAETTEKLIAHGGNVVWLPARPLPLAHDGNAVLLAARQSDRAGPQRMQSTGKGACMEASMVIGHLRFLFPVFNWSTDLYATHETQKTMEENINILFRSFANSS